MKPFTFVKKLDLSDFKLILLVCGAAAITWGCRLIWSPVGWIVGGLLVLVAGWRLR